MYKIIEMCIYVIINISARKQTSHTEVKEGQIPLP